MRALSLGAAPADRRPLSDPYFAPPPRSASWPLAAAIATLPLLVPPGPANTAVVDGVMALSIIMVGIWLHRMKAAVRMPYLLPVGLLMLAGLLAAYWSGAGLTALAVLQDAFVLCWAAAVANAVRHSRAFLQIALRSWVWSGTAWATVLCIGRIAGINALAGVTEKDGGRAALTFNDPNLAGNYFLCCLALLLATAAVRRRVVRAVSAAVILLAIIFTGSNGAALGLATMVAIGCLLTLWNRRGAFAALGVVALAGAGFALISPFVSLSQIQQQASNSVQIVRDSLGRTGESSETREVLASEAIELYLEGDLVGVGPGRTKAALHQTAAPYAKEAHDDYIATLVERGALGGLGLALLITTIAVRVWRAATWPQTPWVRTLVPRPGYLVALLLAFAIAGVFYEVLHFRHLWTLLGLVAGVDPGAERRSGGVPWVP